MSRYALLCVVVLVACAKTEQKADTTRAAAATPTPPPAPPKTIALADVAGKWKGKAMPMNKDTVVTTFDFTATATNDGWSFSFPNGQKPAVKVESVQGDSIVITAGPFSSAVRKGQKVSIHSIMRLQDGKLVSVVHATYGNGDTATFRSEATKSP